MMYIVSSLVVGLALFSFTSATGTMQLNFKRDAELARVIRKRQSGSLPQTNVQFVDDTVYFADVSVCKHFDLEMMLSSHSCLTTLKHNEASTFANPANVDRNPAPVTQVTIGHWQFRRLGICPERD
jgi:hypothetical protein